MDEIEELKAILRERKALEKELDEAEEEARRAAAAAAAAGGGEEAGGAGGSAEIGEDGLTAEQRAERKAEKLRELLAKRAQEQAEKRREAAELFAFGQQAYGRGVYDKSVAILEQALGNVEFTSKLAGEIQLWLAMAYDANGQRPECLALYRKLESNHPMPAIRNQAANMRYIAEAPKLKLSPDEILKVPILDKDNNSPGCMWSQMVSEWQPKLCSGRTWSQMLWAHVESDGDREAAQAHQEAKELRCQFNPSSPFPLLPSRPPLPPSPPTLSPPSSSLSLPTHSSGRTWSQMVTERRPKRIKKLKNSGSRDYMDDLMSFKPPRWEKSPYFWVAFSSFTSRLSADLSSAFPSPINHVLVNEYHEGQGIMATSFPFPINHVLVNEYQEGQGIMDGPAYFPCVAILSLGLPGTMVFSPHQRLLEGSSESGRESSEGACEAALDLMHAQHQRLLEGGREEVLGESEREGDGNDVMEREEAGKKNSSGDAVVMRESVALPPRSLLVFKDQAYTGELVWGEAGEWGSSGDAVEMREGVALPPRSLLVFKDQACTGNEISCASPSRAVIETASVTTRRAALIALSAVIAAQCAGERGAAAAAAGEDGKQRGLSVEQVKDIIARDISEGQYFVTGDLTASIYRDDCRFKDPTNDTSGLARYLAAVSILFDPAFSKQELLSIAVTSDKSVTATAMSKQPTAALPPYPDRFYIAARYAAIPGTVDIPEGAGNSTQYSDLTCLALYSLYQQAVHGPCNKPKPWAWNIVELAKWQSWTELGKMAPVEAMRLFVRALEEEDPNWWTNAQLMEATEPHGAAAVAAAEGYGRGYPEGYAAEGFPAMNGAAFPRGPPVVEDMGVMAVLRSHDCINKWVAAPVTGRKPSARYQRRACARGALLPLLTPPSPSVPSPPPLFIHHAAEILDGRMYVVGGNRARFTSDVHVLDLASLAWSKMELSSPANALPPCAGHSLVMLPPVLLHSLPVPISFPFTAQVILDEVTLLCIGGFFKDGSEKMIVREGGHSTAKVGSTVWVFDISCARGGHSTAKCARGGHSTAKVGSTVWVFGGEDSKRRLLNDVYSLDLTTFVWDKLDTTGTPPLPRAGHTATVYNEHYLTIFGGGSHSMCFNDVHVLDLDAAEWSLAETYGKVPSPRAGLVGVAFGSLWFIMGGGDNHGGVSETMLLDLDSLVWSVVTTSLEKTPLASEGLSVVPVGTSMGPVLVAFGGYNGRYNNEVFLLLPDTAALLRAAEEEEEAAAAATTAAATTTATTAAAAAAATDNAAAAAAAAATAGSASQPPASAPSENSNSQPADSVTASSAPAAGSAPPPSLPSGAAAALGPTPSAPAAIPPPAPTTGIPPATAAGGKQIVRAGSASNIIGAAPPGGIPVGIPGGISGGIPGAAAVPVPGLGPPLPAGAGVVVGVEDGGELSPTSRDAVLLAQLEEAEAAATRAEKVALNARAEASQTAAEARADAWAAIAKAQMEVDLLKQQLATAIKAKQQAEDEMAEGQAKVVAAQAASASAQAEAGQIRKDLNDCRIKVHELEAELAKKSGADGGMATLQKDYAAVKNALADMEQELTTARTTLAAEQARCFRLEVEVAEYRQRLAGMADLEREVELLQRQQAAADAMAAAAAGKGKGWWGGGR
ncbi:unnamed protein product [Closterium sp. NIES-64]|nr:unnamed protein product [Closterium sp. NIES-64]